MADDERRAERTFTFEPRDLDVLCESLWHSLQRADVPDEDLERIHALRKRLNSARDVDFRMLDERAARLEDAVKRAVQELPLTRVDSEPSDYQDGPSRAGARLRLALRAVHSMAARSPQGEDHDQAAAHEAEMRAAHEMPRGEGHER